MRQQNDRSMTKRLIYTLAVLDIFLAGVAVAVWQMPPRTADGSSGEDTLVSVTRVVYADTVAKMENQPVSISDNTERTEDRQPAAAQRREIRADISQIAKGNPFYYEAAKVTAGKLEEKDAGNRMMILNYCEHLRTSYTTKDIDFIRQVMSDKALIIVGNVVSDAKGTQTVQGDERVTFSMKTKAEYMARLERVFAANKKIDVTFSDFSIMRHPTTEGIYGVTLRQGYKSDRYADDGWLFLLWDFRNRSMPVIHVRTWQPYQSVEGDNEVIGLHDFNLQ